MRLPSNGMSPIAFMRGSCMTLFQASLRACFEDHSIQLKTTSPRPWPSPHLLSGGSGGLVRLEHGDLRVERALEGGPRLATRLVAREIGEAGDEVGVAHDAQHRRHHQVAGGEAVLEIVALAQPLGEPAEPRADRVQRAG